MKSARFVESYGQFQLLFARLRGECLGRVRYNNREIYGCAGSTYESIKLDMINWINSNQKAKGLIKEFRRELVFRTKILATYNGVDIRANIHDAVALAIGNLRDQLLFEVEATSIDAAVNLIKVDIDQNKDLIDRTVKQNHQNLLRKFGVPAFEKIQCISTDRVENYRSTYCWACHHPIDSDSHLKCNGCGWILCFCGACGCSYRLSKPVN